MKKIINYTENVIVINGRIVRELDAETNIGTFHIYRIDEDGNESYKNLAYCCVGGYFVYPGNDRWSNKFIHCKSLREDHSATLTDKDREAILSIHPDFKWTLQKAGCVTLATAMRLLINWKKNPAVEMLVAAGYRTLMLNKSFIRMGKDKQKSVLQYVKSNPDAKDWSLNKILFAIKKGNTEEYDRWQKFRNDFGKLVEFKWWKKYGSKSEFRLLSKLHTYRDYMRMCERCGHDTKDPYWKYPKDINTAHDKVQAEYELVLDAERKAQDRERIRNMRKKVRKFKNFASKFLDDTAKTKGFKASIPQDLETVKAQAKALHQCLITADYFGDMANRELILIFITGPDGKPAATAEFLPNGNIGQFYANQENEDTMDPSREMRMALNSWLKRYKDKATRMLNPKAA